jgi:hypothetical protein
MSIRLSMLLSILTLALAMAPFSAGAQDHQPMSSGDPSSKAEHERGISS